MTCRPQRGLALRSFFWMRVSPASRANADLTRARKRGIPETGNSSFNLAAAMSSSDDIGQTIERRRRRRRNSLLLLLVAGFLLFGAAAGPLYYALKPVMLSPIATDGAVQSIALLGAAKADLAVARADLDMPADAETVAIVRKNLVVLWAPSGLPGHGAKKQPAGKIKAIDDLAGHKVGVIGRTQANVALLRVILTESGIDADKVATTQFGTDQIAELARDPSI